MPTSCVVCKGSSQCQRCLIKDLTSRIELLNYELSYLRKGSNNQLQLPQDYSQHFELDNKFLPIIYYGTLEDYGFLTITFDPNKFGLFNQPKDEQNYIFKQLKQAITDQYIFQLTGCFEYQKNGAVHAHLIIKSDYTNSQIEDYFRLHFTNDPRNRYAIKCFSLQKDKCESYIQKESQEYYRYDQINGFDENVSVSDNPEFQQTVIPLEMQQFNQLLASYRQQQKIDLNKFESRLRTKYNLNTRACEVDNN